MPLGEESQEVLVKLALDLLQQAEAGTLDPEHKPLLAELLRWLEKSLESSQAELSVAKDLEARSQGPKSTDS